MDREYIEKVIGSAFADIAALRQAIALRDIEIAALRQEVEKLTPKEPDEPAA